MNSLNQRIYEDHLGCQPLKRFERFKDYLRVLRGMDAIAAQVGDGLSASTRVFYAVEAGSLANVGNVKLSLNTRMPPDYGIFSLLIFAVKVLFLQS